jgi:transcriptional regulator GlxA family with amidase domain
MLVERNRRTADGRCVPRSVSCALNAMRAAPERALNLTALAAISRVSARTLQRHFQAFVVQDTAGCSPRHTVRTRA